MQTFSTKASAITYASEMGWKKVDVMRSVEALSFPADEMTILNLMVRFAGPELDKRQRAQGRQKGIVTTKAKEIESLSKSFSAMVQDYEDQIESDRSAFVPIVKTLYSFAKPFGYRSAWIEALLATYQKYITQNQASAPQKKTS
jgi:HAMP domain-containing protein